MDEFYPFLEAFFSGNYYGGIIFILWDIYFAYQNVWGFNDEYLIGIRWFKLPLEEWLFFLLIPYASNFIHYSLEYFFRN
jgi:lycopene cyclase domain-containing protein